MSAPASAPTSVPTLARSLGSQRWVFTMTVAFLYAAAVLRSVLAFSDGRRVAALILALAWLVLVLTEPALSRRFRPYFGVYVFLQAAVIAVALTLSDSSDFFAILLAVPSMQAAMRWRVGRTAVLIGIFALLTGLCLIHQYGVAQAVTFAAIYAGADVFLAAYALATKRATEARLRNEALAADLRQTNTRLADYAAQAERLAGARERQRLARDLHDSVTQTLFSMTLTARSALLLLQRSPGQVAAQLDQVDELARSALREMDLVSADLPASPPAGEDLPAALARHLRDRERADGLAVTLEVEADEPGSSPPQGEGGKNGAPPWTETGVLPSRGETGEATGAGAPSLRAESAALLRIVQEALNNVVKHAGTQTATVRLRLRPPRRLEIEDRGRGFDPERTVGRGLGLGGMRERAAEIGWSLTVDSSPGAGTRVVAEETSSEGGRDSGPQ
jgi:signal transduction histidine kinase